MFTNLRTRCVPAKKLQSCLTLCDLTDGSPPGSSVHGVLQARILEWVAVPSSRGDVEIMLDHPGRLSAIVRAFTRGRQEGRSQRRSGDYRGRGKGTERENEYKERVPDSSPSRMSISTELVLAVKVQKQGLKLISVPSQIFFSKIHLAIEEQPPVFLGRFVFPKAGFS